MKHFFQMHLTSSILIGFWIELQFLNPQNKLLTVGYIYNKSKEPFCVPGRPLSSFDKKSILYKIMYGKYSYMGMVLLFL